MGIICQETTHWWLCFRNSCGKMKKANPESSSSHGNWCTKSWPPSKHCVGNWSYQVDVEVYLRIPVWIHHRIYIYIFFFSKKITGCNWIFNNSWNCLSSLRRFQDAECERRSSLGFHSLRLPTHHVTLWAPWLASKSIGSRNSIRHFSKDAWNVTIKRWFKTSTFFRCQMKSVSLEVDTPSRCECKMPLHRERCFNGLYVSELPISRKSLKPPGPNLDSGDHLLGSASKWDKKNNWS